MIRWLGQASCGDDGTGWDRAWQRLECEVLDDLSGRRLAARYVLARARRAGWARLDSPTPEGRSPFDRMKAAGFTGTSMAEVAHVPSVTARGVGFLVGDSPDPSRYIGPRSRDHLLA